MLLYSDLTYAINGAAFHVYNKLGHGLIQQRNLNDPEGKILEWEVDGDHIQAIHMLPGYTHNIINLSDTEDLVTVMYCNEIFNPNKPDTFFEKV